MNKPVNAEFLELPGDYKPGKGEDISICPTCKRQFKWNADTPSHTVKCPYDGTPLKKMDVDETQKIDTTDLESGGERNPNQAGPGGYCVCPKCGTRKKHDTGTPCAAETCPKCGTAMQREIQKIVTSYANLPVNSSKVRTWDVTAAENRIRKWASSDGSGNKDKMNWQQYGKAFFYHDPEKKEDFTGYKLPYADIINGRLEVIWRSLVAVMAVLNGSRGGAEIPESDRVSIYNQIKRYYAKFDEEVPELKKSIDLRSLSTLMVPGNVMRGSNE